MSDPWGILEPGSHLLYGVAPFLGIPGADPFGRITSLKTWGPSVHVEEYVGNGQSVASRNGKGVDIYPVRTAQLIGVLEPKQTINIERALAWFNEPYDLETNEGQRGRPYGWQDLLRFYNIRLHCHGVICSQFVTLFDNAGDFWPFAPDYYAGAIDPNDFFESPLFTWKWVDEKARKALGKF